MSPAARIALVVNPVATRSRTGERAEVTRCLSPLGLEWSLVTTAPGDAGRLTAQAVAEGASVVVSLGGDGTSAEVAAALAGSDVAMAALPGGNANVFARASGWPASLRSSLPLLRTALAEGSRGTSPLGHIALDDDAEHIFLTNAGVGIDAATVEWVEARPRVKRRMRHVSFAVAAALAAGRAARGPRLHISADGGPSMEAVTALVACGSPYTYLGPRPLDLVPGAGVEGHLAWVALTRVRAIELGGLMVRALAGHSPAVGRQPLDGGTLRAELVVRADRAVPVQADGEPLGRHTEVRISPGPMLATVDPRGGAPLKSTGREPT